MKTYLAKTLTVLAISTSATVTVLGGGIKGAIASSFNPENLQDFGAPEQTAGGGTRHGCLTPASKSLTPLTPHKLKLAENQTVMPLTVQSHPSFFWYVPETAAETVEFILATENDDIVYQTQLTIPDTAGIMSVSLPREEQYALQEGTRYHWIVSLVCDGSDRTADIYTDGWIQRLAADSELAQTVAQSQDPEDFASAGIWQEALAYLARQRRDNPEDSTIALEWKEFLESVELGQFADVEFVSSQPSTRVASDSLPQ